MMTVMKTLAHANGWDLVLDLNSVLSLRHGSVQFLVDNPHDAFHLIPDIETRKLMIQQFYRGGH